MEQAGGDLTEALAKMAAPLRVAHVLLRCC